MVDKKKGISIKTKKLLWWAGFLFAISLLFYMWMVIHYKLTWDAIILMFFLYWAVYAWRFWLCTQIAYKLKNLLLWKILFVGGLLVAFLIFWLSVS